MVSKRLEVAIRSEDPDVSLCYWDSTLDSALPTPADSVMWLPEVFFRCIHKSMMFSWFLSDFIQFS